MADDYREKAFKIMVTLGMLNEDDIDSLNRDIPENMVKLDNSLGFKNMCNYLADLMNFSTNIATYTDCDTIAKFLVCLLYNEE